MTSPDEPTLPDRGDRCSRTSFSLESSLFESLIHHLHEKGILTRNDALSVVQTVAEVKQGALDEGGERAEVLCDEVALLHRMYRSFELLPDRQVPVSAPEGGNVTRLRAPLHREAPTFPMTD